MSDISEAGKALAFLSRQYDNAEVRVYEALQNVYRAQEVLSRAIDTRDAIQKTINLAAHFITKETK